MTKKQVKKNYIRFIFNDMRDWGNDKYSYEKSYFIWRDMSTFDIKFGTDFNLMLDKMFGEDHTDFFHFVFRHNDPWKTQNKLIKSVMNEQRSVCK